MTQSYSKKYITKNLNRVLKNSIFRDIILTEEKRMYTNEKQNLETRKRMFEIIDKFVQDKQKRKDYLELAEILVYDTPYQNRIIHPTKKEELTIKLKKLRYFDGRYTHQKELLIDPSGFLDPFYDLIIILPHEYTHFMQHKINLSNKLRGGILNSQRKQKK